MIGKNRVFLSHTDRTSGLKAVRPPCHHGLYARSRYCMFALRVFGENLIFSPLSTYSPTPRVTRNNLKPSSLDYNLHAM
jgi:hypothetical protein